MFYKIKNDNNEVLGMNIGTNISALRKAKGITQEELANELGVSAQAVSKWENDSSCPDISLLTKIADYFGVTVDALLRSSEDEITNNESKPSTDKTKISAKNICIKIIQSNGKTNNIKIPFKLAKLGLNIGSMFGLDKNIANSITEMVNNEDIGNIIDIDAENGEHITISIK